jgi:GAF domain-containing protein
VKEALQALAEVAGIALERANRTRTLSGLNEAGKALTGAPDLQSVLAEAVRRTETLLGADAVVLYLYDQQSDYLQIPPTQAGLYQPNVLMQPGTFHENSVPRRLIRSGKSHFARNAARDKVMAGSIRAADDVPTFVQRERIASSAGVLLKVMNEIVGVLFVNYRSRHAFGESEREKIELFASQAAIAIRNAALLEELSDRATRLKLLHDIASSVSARAVGPKEVSLLIVQSLSDKVFKEAACAIRLYNSKTDEFIPLQIATGPLKDLIEHPPRSDGTSRYVVREKAPLYIEDTSSPPSPGVPCVRQEFLERGVKAIAYLPLIGEGGVVTGILYMNLFTPYRFSENDRLILELFAHQAAVSIERERQFELLQAVNQLGDNLAALE